LAGKSSLNTKSAKTMELEQRYVIKFFADEGMQGVQILSRLRDHYGTEALSRTEVYYWINEVKRGKADLNIVASPGGEPDEGLAIVIAGKLDADPHLSARKPAHSLGIAASTVCHSLTEVLGMKYRHVRWVLHMLTQPQKDARIESAQAMFRELAKHQASNFRFLFTGDESWLFYAYRNDTMWAASWDDVDGIERPSHFHKKMMFVIFFNGNGDHASVILPQGQRMNSTFLIEYIIRHLA
jgi:hypothetical protein